MATSRRHDEAEGASDKVVSSSGTRVKQADGQDNGAGVSPSPLKTKARQAQRRYRSLFHQAAREYQGWCEGEDDSQRAIGSVCHMLDRLRMLEPGQNQDGNGTLGGLSQLPDCRALLIQKHTVELERVMRLWRALVHQMKNQVSRVEEALSEAWQMHRYETAARVVHSESFDSSKSQSREVISPAAARSSQTSAIAVATHVRGGSAIGSAEYLQWLGDLSSMLVHEQWRKEELLSKVDFGPETSSVRIREHVRAQWSSRSADSILNRTFLDGTLKAAQVVPLPKARS